MYVNQHLTEIELNIVKMNRRLNNTNRNDGNSLYGKEKMKKERNEMKTQ